MGNTQVEAMSVDTCMLNAKTAAAVFTQLDQAQVDRIVRAAYEAGFAQRISLAKEAATETGMGRWEDKVVKNVVGTQFVYESIRYERTVGVISEDFESGIAEIAQPLGPVLAVIPVTNPTSTTMFKILICLKTRNPIIISPHRNATACSIRAARLMYEAAMAEDAPEHCIQWMPHTDREQTQALMGHRDLALILATGGTGLVNAAYSSGNPALGVGAGNVPVFIDESADMPFAVSQIFMSKTFDNGTICASEQAVVIFKAQAAAFRHELEKQGGYMVPADKVPALEAVCHDEKRGGMSPAVVGQSAEKIAALAGIGIPAGTRILVAPQKGVGKEFPLSGEVLAPVLAYYEAADFDEAVKICIDLNYHGGTGHTAAMYSNDDANILRFSQLMNAGRIVVNTPSSQGAVGGIFNTLTPSLTLGCGTSGKNITTDNITARHLVNIQRVARRRVNRRFAAFDAALYFDEKLSARDIEKEFNKNF